MREEVIKNWWEPSNDGTDEPVINWLSPLDVIYGGVLHICKVIPILDWPACPAGMNENDNRRVRAQA